jgi:integrin beta 1
MFSFHLFRKYFNLNSTCKYIEDPPNSVDYSSVVNKSLTTSSADEFIQISPQYIKLKLRVGQEEEVKFSVAQAMEYPVDLYYLMDLSNSMSDDRDNIVKLGGDLATAIEKITKDYRIG